MIVVLRSALFRNEVFSLYRRAYVLGQPSDKGSLAKKNYPVSLPTVVIIGFIASLMSAVASLTGGERPNRGAYLETLVEKVGFLSGGNISYIILSAGGVLFFIAWFALAPYAGFKWSFLGTVPEKSILTLPQALGIFFLWIFPFLIAIPIYSQDIYAYLAFGKATALGFNPYSGSPAEFFAEGNMYRENVGKVWVNSSSPYGPVHMIIVSIISRLAGDSLFALFFSYRILFLLCLAIFLWSSIKIIELVGLDLPKFLWFVMLSPIIVIQGFASMHNDMWAITFLAVGILFTLWALKELDKDRGFKKSVLYIALAFLFFIFAAQIKINILVFIACSSVAYVTKYCDSRGHFQGLSSALRSWLYLIIAGCISLVYCGLTLPVTFMINMDLSWITNLSGTVGAYKWQALPTFLGNLVAVIYSIFDPAGAPAVRNIAGDIFRTILFILFFYVTIRVLFDVINKRITFVESCGVITLFLLASLPVIYPWYFMWIIFPLALWIRRDKVYAVFAIIVMLSTVSLTVRGVDNTEDIAFVTLGFWYATLLSCVIAAVVIALDALVKRISRKS